MHERGEIQEVLYTVEYRLTNGFLIGVHCSSENILYPGELFVWSIQCERLRFLVNFKKIECSSELNELIVRRRIRNIFDLFCLPPNSLNFSDDDQSQNRRRRSASDASAADYDTN